MRFLICGDVVPTDASREGFASGDIQGLFGNVLPVFASSDRVLVNLECALTEGGTPIPKFGPNLGAPIASAAALKAAGVTDCGLANNHMFDFGSKGMMDTLKAIEDAGMCWTGAGMNEEDSRKPLIIPVGQRKLALIAVSEHEYNYALEDQMGATPFDPFHTLVDIKAAKEKYDYVIVTYHGGKEHCRYPSPRLLRACRAMAEMGADAVFCQHSHIIGCMEKYKDSVIVYGQGNFHFVKYLDNETWNQGLMAQLDFDEETGKFDMKLIPVIAENTGIRLADEAEAEVILCQMRERDQKLLDGSWVDGWREFCESVRPGYEASIYNAQDDAENPRKKEHFAHYLDCEAHTDVYRELFATWHKKGINE